MSKRKAADRDDESVESGPFTSLNVNPKSSKRKAIDRDAGSESDGIFANQNNKRKTSKKSKTSKTSQTSKMSKASKTSETKEADGDDEIVDSDPDGLFANLNNKPKMAAFMIFTCALEELRNTAEDYECTADLVNAPEMKEADFQACFKLIEQTSRHDYEPSSFGWHPKRKLSEMKDKRMGYFVIKDDSDAIQGFLSFMLTYDSVPVVQVLYVYEIHLSERLRGLGLGKALMAMAFSFGKSSGAHKIMLTCFKSNVKARAFYERLGYGVDVSSPEDRTTRNNVIETDYVIMSKEVGKLQPWQLFPETKKSTTTNAQLEVSKPVADDSSASRQSLPGGVPSGQAPAESGVAEPSAQPAIREREIVMTQEKAEQLWKKLTDRHRMVLGREQICVIREQNCKTREQKCKEREQQNERREKGCAEWELECEDVQDSLDGREKELDQREQYLDEKEDLLFQREAALRESLATHDLARLNVRARGRALQKREIRFDNRERKDRERRAREAAAKEKQGENPVSILDQKHPLPTWLEKVNALLGDDNDAPEDEEEEEDDDDDVEEDGEEEDCGRDEGGEEDDEEEEEDYSFFEECDDPDGEIFSKPGTAQAKREARKVGVLGKHDFELPKPEAMHGQKVVKDKVDTWLRRSGSTADSFAKRN